MECRVRSASASGKHAPGRATQDLPVTVTEGEDKPLKYPTIFNSADVAVITKTDLSAASEFSWDEAERSVQSVRPGTPLLGTSARTRNGMPEHIAFLEERQAEMQVTAP